MYNELLTKQLFLIKVMCYRCWFFLGEHLKFSKQKKSYEIEVEELSNALHVLWRCYRSLSGYSTRQYVPALLMFSKAFFNCSDVRGSSAALNVKKYNVISPQIMNPITALSRHSILRTLINRASVNQSNIVCKFEDYPI